MELSAAGLFRAKWTDRIQEEWITNLLLKRNDLKREQLDRTKELMARALPDCLVNGFEALEPSLELPDPDDRHVLAAAIHCKADVIVTFNLQDFPPENLSKFDLEVQHPDEFIHHQFGLNHAGVLTAVQRCRRRLKNPPKTAEEYLSTLEAQSLPQTTDVLQEYADVI
jgi:predicted nucleic acid-binding protein